ncbi:hypothetical protein CEN44_11030 [Fischerella muscicola CCMEE 5323]|uniref:Bacteriocin n=1 Tax=Fischerella muscicola CCMEE 5323 TaxID=2019572 RepID=A0A2N6K3Q5_FISMU|nr:hypothetical protein [Fischerella muscicola]PLZ90293.1 hypothetical protein CEN44_11030 [Fischerella muscicola CCMEE 5323]
MSTIKVSDLSHIGLELFSDSENYMLELDNNEFDNIAGGFQNGCFPDTFTNPPKPYPLSKLDSKTYPGSFDPIY